MTIHMQVCEIGVPHWEGAIFPPTTVNFAENGTFWLSVKDCSLSKDLVPYEHATPVEKNQCICLLIQWTEH